MSNNQGSSTPAVSMLFGIAIGSGLGLVFLPIAGVWSIPVGMGAGAGIGVIAGLFASSARD